MVVESHLASLIRTKLHRPRVPGDIVCRERLHQILEAGRDRPLTLVSAPAGYGKSTLISHWLEESGSSHAWLSLDEGDSDLKLFLAYVLSAVRTVFPEACPDSWSALSAGDLSSVPALASLLINELDALETPFTLVLDDYHRIRKPVIHNLMDTLLRHPPRPLHLVIVSRRDPALSLQSMHARGSVTEVRQQDLQLETAESVQLVERIAGIHLSNSAGGHLQKKLEGWAAGLRLVSLALRGQNDVDAVLKKLSVDTRHVSDYLVDEVLDHQSPVIHDYLCKTSILDRFCAPLCGAVFGEADEPGGNGLDGRAFVDWLVEANLFCISLDERNEWHRYHHLFQQLLQRHLETHYSEEEIAGLHRRASQWFEENGYFEEALGHLLAADDMDGAANLISCSRHRLMNEEQWHRLNLCLRRLSPETVEENADLLSLTAWTYQRRNMFLEAWDTLDRLEPLLSSKPGGEPVGDTILGEYQALRSFQNYMRIEGGQAMAQSTEALEHLPEWCRWARSFAGLIQALASQMLGDLEGARRSIHRRLAREGESKHIEALSLAALCFADQIAGDLSSLRRSAARYLEHGVEHGLPESVSVGRYFVGVERYLANDLAGARGALSPVLSERSIANFGYHVQSFYILGLTHEVLGESGEARVMAETAISSATEASNIHLLQTAQAFQAELDLRQGRIMNATRWAASFEAAPNPLAFRFYVPELTLARVLLAEASPASLRRCSELLSRLKKLFESIFSTRLLIDVLVLQAQLLQQQGRDAAAVKTLQRAVTLALPTGMIRPFVDPGPGLGQLLHRLDLEGEALQYVGLILAAFQGSESGSPTDPAAPPPQPLIDPLTSRELDVLALLDKRLSNQEIADKLFISVETVKKHTGSIYGKLGVKGRRQAVTKAAGLGILTSS